jgi:subtilisin family serine protease
MASLSGVDVRPDLRKIDPLARVTDAPAVTGAQTKILGASPGAGILFPVLIRLSRPDETMSGKIRNVGGTAKAILPRLYTARIPWDSTRYLSNWEEVAYIEAAKKARPHLDLSRPAVFADDVQTGTPTFPPPFDSTGFTGRGVYIGIVDTGLSQGHLDFFTDGDPGQPRVVTWFPSQATAGVDTEGHGTHVTGIAAGNGFLSGGLYTGMALEAGLLIGKTTFGTDDILNDIGTLLSQAQVGDVPIAVNLSLGLATGPHDGTSLFEEGVNALATGTPPGGRQIIVAAAGNERDVMAHFQATLLPFEPVTAPLTLFPNPFPSFRSGLFVDIWADGGDSYKVTATHGSAVTALPGPSPVTSGGITVFNQAEAPPNGATHITVFFTPPTDFTPASILLERIQNGGSGRIDAYIDIEDGHFTTSDEAGTITEPANADNVIAVGSFNTKPGDDAGAVGGISLFSSLGPTRDGHIKPDLAAPGSVIFSARSAQANADNFTDVVDENYAVLQGTSMSAPHVAGIAALVWESNPNLTGAQMRERLKRTASAPTDGSAVPNMTWGYGKVNALSAITETVAGISGPARTRPGQILTLRADEKSSGPYGNAVTYSWSAPGATVTPTETGAQTKFTADAPGDYPVTLTAAPGSAPYNQAGATIRVNNVPTASISGPAAVDNITSVTFTGTGNDDDPQQSLSFHWILVARPSGSASVLTTANVENVTLVPDVSGTYELGLRVNDGLDDSALATHTVAVALVTNSSGGGGGCFVVNGTGEDDAATIVAALLLLLSPLGVLCARKIGRGHSSPASRI